MTTLKDARRLWQETQRKFAPQTPVRYGFLGDGRGNANSNIYVPSGSNTLLWARERVGSERFFPVLNKDAVIPQFNLPVVIGYQPDDLRQEQVLRVHIGGLGTVATSGVALLGPHHTQHEWDGGDVVFVDGLQFKPGLAQPTSPASMSLKVLSFIYFWDKWKQFPITTTGTLTQFKPGAGKSVYVLIALDPTTDTLVYRPGLPYTTPTIASITSFDFNNVPAPAGNEFPITFVGLDSATTVLSWGSLDNSIADARLHVNAPLLNILDRLRQLEGYSGNEPSIATTGAAASTVSDQNRTLGGLTNVNTDGATDTQALVFNQATNRWIPGTAVGGGGSFTLNFNNNPILTGQATLLQGTGASLSQSGASITISATGGGAALDPSTPAGVGASPNAGNSASAAAGNHIHKGVLSILAGTGASVETSTAGCVTIGLTGSGWTSAIQLASRTTGVTYTNGSLTRFVSAVYAASTTLLAQANLQFKTGAASPPANIIGETLVAGVADAFRETLGGFVLPNEYYTVIDLSQAGASINLSKWTEYDDYGGAPAPSIVNRVFNGRLTLDGSNAIGASDITAASAIWYVPYVGNNVSLYTSGSVWNTITFNSASLALTGLSPNSNYDIWGYQNSAELSLLTTRWNVNDITRLNGLSQIDGIQSEGANPTRAYLGTIRITGTSAQSEDSKQKRFVWNNYNRVTRYMLRQDPTATWSYNSAIFRQADNSSANFVSAVVGIPETPTMVEVLAGLNNPATIVSAGTVGIGINGTSTNAADVNNEWSVNTAVGPTIRTVMVAKLAHIDIGYYSYNWLESVRAGSITFEGDIGIKTKSGILGYIVG